MRYEIVNMYDKKWIDLMTRSIAIIKKFIKETSCESMRDIFMRYNDYGQVDIEEIEFSILYEYDPTGEYDSNTNWMHINENRNNVCIIYMDDFERLLQSNKKEIDYKCITKTIGNLMCYEEFKNKIKR